ncbi:hypothetical protein [Methylobacterium nonmethylotrophicum]|uniref:Transmembrane protein n=1 Tax=Methylobacterium nonmethylotrophicum TaxID=1141884 RepID=A0A4Z0NQM5_9HYPH|nr:hypothetical protein [Methylobacterium nonmethylotrophicum]TGD98625.1 hypothetical protein EU555_14880 [Methylobacterium nonmethylotrophicum]
MEDQAKQPLLRGIVGVNLGHLIISILFILFLSSPFLFYAYIKSTNIFPNCLSENCKQHADYRYLVSSGWSAIFSLAATAGCLGTIVSFFLRQTKNDPIYREKANGNTLNANFVFIGLREISLLCFLGIVFGVLMIALFMGGFVKGNLFPDIVDEKSSWIDFNIRVDDWAKTFIWCFLAGFSERLIPSLLDGLVRRVDANNSQTAEPANVEIKANSNDKHPNNK